MKLVILGTLAKYKPAKYETVVSSGENIIMCVNANKKRTGEVFRAFYELRRK